MRNRKLGVALFVALALLGCSKKNGVPAGTPLGKNQADNTAKDTPDPDKEFVRAVTMPLNVSDFLASKDVDVTKNCLQLVKKKSTGKRYLQIAQEKCPGPTTLPGETKVKGFFELQLTGGPFNTTGTSFELFDNDANVDVGNMSVSDQAGGESASLFALCSDTFADYTGACQVIGDATTKFLIQVQAD